MHPTQQESQGQIEYDKILHKVEHVRQIHGLAQDRHAL